jgi:ribosomal protein S18 acetylase RimI-like enzyme
MKIINSTAEDAPNILELYALATEFQKEKFEIHWPSFATGLVEQEIAECRQWKLLIDKQIACVWVTNFDDPQIWEDRNKDPSVYIHRIATHPDFRGQNLVTEIVKWCKTYAKHHNKKFIRMDTVGNNSGLIKYYQRCGFKFLGLFELSDTTGLPAHYHMGPVSLFQIEL